MNKFKVGDKILLKSYDQYEYPRYKGQTATITGMENGSDSFDYCIKWSNGSLSCISHYNTIPAFTTWKKRYEAKNE